MTILFADIAGSTALGEATDPEDVRALMSAYARIAREVIGARGGTVEKFIGDAVMAVFGVPQAHDDDPDRALAAALALRDAVARDPATAALALRIGVNTGEVVAARDARVEMLVSGDTVNVAARIQQAASPGEILVGERTIAATRGRATFGEQRALDVKGKSAPIRAAVLLAHEASPARAEEPPFVGRAADLAQLALVATMAFTESRPQLVTISAPAGTGKSRLVSVFVERARAERPALRVATAQCLPYGSGTYLPMRALLASLLRVAEADLDAPSIERALAARGMPPADAERVAALVATTLGLTPDTAEREREEFFTAWRTCVEGLASGEPTVLVLEDLHWAAESLFDLIEHVTQPRTRAPLLMVALTRPELFDRRPTWGTARRNATSIMLDPLGEDDTAELLRALVPDAPSAALARMSERAEGNPFFAVELARGLRERGEEAALPDTVQASVLARLDLLPDAERRALQLGSVVGRSVPPAALAQLVGAPVTATLDALADRDLVVPQLDGAYDFRHIVIREVAYGTLPRTERARAHVVLARWLSGLSDTPPELVAYHYRQALTLSPRSLSDEDLTRAVRALETAAAFAKRTGADREAVALLRAAIQYAPAEEQIRLHERLGDALELTDEAADAYAEAFARWDALPAGARDPRDGARLLRKRAIVYVRWGGSIRRLPRGRDVYPLLETARALLAAAPDPVESARLDVVHVFLSQYNTLNRDLEPAQRLSPEGSLKLGESARATLASDDADAESEALDALAAAARAEDLNQRSIDYSRQRMRLPGLSLLERADAVAMVCNGLALLGDFDAVLDAFAAHLAALRPGEPEGFYAYPHTWAVSAARLSGRWDDALRIGDRVVDIVETGERSARAPIAAATLATAAYVARARIDQARFERYRSAASSIAEGLPPETFGAALCRLVFNDDAANALTASAGPGSAGGGLGEMVLVLLFDHDLPVDDATLANLERLSRTQAAVVVERWRLVRAARSGPAAMREAIAALGSAGLTADAARAMGLLARMTGDAQDRAAAEGPLRALGDHAYLARLEEPFEPRSG